MDSRYVAHSRVSRKSTYHPFCHLQIPFTAVDAGLPCIFIPAASILGTVDPQEISALLRRRPDELDSDTALHARLEQLRAACSQAFPLLAKAFSISAPKICIVSTPFTYSTTGGNTIEADDVDCVVRAVSVGNFHRTVPATMLSALAVARALPGSVVDNESIARPWSRSAAAKGVDGSRSTVRVGQPAGISEASVALSKEGLPTSIAYTRTARCLFRGDVQVPTSII